MANISNATIPPTFTFSYLADTFLQSNLHERYNAGEQLVKKT